METRVVDGQRTRGSAEVRVAESVENDKVERKEVRTLSLARVASMVQRPTLSAVILLL